jgi:4-hydroxyphenylacetate 3-monooxygenase
VVERGRAISVDPLARVCFAASIRERYPKYGKQERKVIRTGEEYRESIRDGREVWIDGERVEDVTTHPAFKPIVDVRARIYDLAHEDGTRDVMSYVDPDTGERCPTGSKLPLTREDWHAKRAAVDTVLDDIGGIVTRVGDETVGEMWSLYDGQDVLNEIDARFSENIRRHVHRAAVLDPFHVSANTDPKGDRSKRPQEQDPDVLLHVVGETDNGIVVRGAKFETAAAYANQAFVKPTIGDWGDAELSEYAVGFLADMAAPGVKHICRTSFAGRLPDDDYPLSGRFDEVDTMIVFDDVEIPWENVFFYRHTRAAAFIRATLHRYSMFPFVQRHLRFADLLLGVAYTNVTQTGVKMHQGVREKLAELACYRESINAHLTAAIELAEPSPGGLSMPNPELLYTGRVVACTQLPAMMHLARDLCGGQLCVTPDAASFRGPETGPWLEKYYRVGEWEAEDRRRLFAFARDLLNSGYAGHRLTFQLFAQSPPFAHLLAVYNNYDFSGPYELVRRYAGLSGSAVLAEEAV